MPHGHHACPAHPCPTLHPISPVLKRKSKWFFFDLSPESGWAQRHQDEAPPIW